MKIKLFENCKKDQENCKNIKPITSYFFLIIFSTYLLILYVFIYEIYIYINYILILLKLFEKLNFNKNQLSEIETCTIIE